MDELDVPRMTVYERGRFIDTLHPQDARSRREREAIVRRHLEGLVADRSAIGADPRIALELALRDIRRPH